MKFFEHAQNHSIPSNQAVSKIITMNPQKSAVSYAIGQPFLVAMDTIPIFHKKSEVPIITLRQNSFQI